MSECKHQWEEDEFFAEGGVMMFTGKMGNIHQETRMVCKKCNKIDYIKKEKEK